MFIAILAVAALAALVFIGRGGSDKAKAWRVISGVGATAVLVGAAILVLRGEWPLGTVIGVIGGVMALSARLAPGRTSSAQSGAQSGAPGQMSEAQARSVLGLGPTDGPAEIAAAYHRLIQRVHPDKGGAPGLAAQLNAARDRLLKPAR